MRKSLFVIAGLVSMMPLASLACEDTGYTEAIEPTKPTQVASSKNTEPAKEASTVTSVVGEQVAPVETTVVLSPTSEARPGT
jgi:hypothetical protein